MKGSLGPKFYALETWVITKIFICIPMNGGAET